MQEVYRMSENMGRMFPPVFLSIKVVNFSILNPHVVCPEPAVPGAQSFLLPGYE